MMKVKMAGYETTSSGFDPQSSPTEGFEKLNHNPRVGGSSPSTNYFNNLCNVDRRAWHRFGTDASNGGA
jgi:hypothetical protein